MEIVVLFGLLLFFIPFVVPIITYLSLRSARSRLAALEDALVDQARTVEALEGQLAQLRREMREPVAPPVVAPAPAAEPERPPASVPAAAARVSPPPNLVEPPAAAARPAPQPTSLPVLPEPAAVPAPAPPMPVAPAPRPVVPVPAASERPAEPKPAPPPPPRPKPPAPPTPPPPPPPEPRRSFDWENLAGAKVFPAVAGIALVIGAISFLRYSIESGWLQPPIRVMIGIAVAIALLIVCELKAARKYATLANALDAAAIAILFATFFAAHALWDLIPGGIAFVLLGVVAALAVLLSIRRESLFIAVLGLLGGFATPILLSTGENRPIPLFAYLLLLNVGLAWVAYRNTWPILTALTLVFTTIYQWGWVLKYLHNAADLPLAMGIFLVFPIVTFAGVLLRGRTGTGDPAARATFERTALGAAIVPVIFAVFLAAVPAYGARAWLLFGFLLLIDMGLLAISIARREMTLHAIAGLATLLTVGVWLGLSYFSDARLVVLGFTAAFVTLFLAADPLARRFGAVTADAAFTRYTAPLLLVVFPALANLDPAFAQPRLLFATQLLLLLACAWRAIATRDGYLYFIAAFFSIAGQAVWSVEHLTEATLRTAVAIYVVFGVVGIAVPLIARRTGRPLEPAGGGGVVLIASLGLLLYLSMGPISLTTLWALALLLAILNAGLFVESAGARLPAVAILGSLVSWLVLASWWFRAAGAVGVLPSLAVLVGLTLITLAGHAWTNARAERPSTPTLESGLWHLLSSGLFLGLIGHLFLYLLAFNREWSLPPWPLFGGLLVITLGTTAATLYSRVAPLHAVGVAAAAMVVAAWASVAAGPPWPTVALLAGAAVSAYALGFAVLWRGRGEYEVPAVGAAAALFVGELTAILAVDGAGSPPIAFLTAAHVANLAAILTLTWIRGWRWVAIGAAVTAWAAVFGWTGPWSHLLLLASAMYALLLAYPLVLGSRVREHRDPHLAAIVGSTMFFFAGREALDGGGYDWIVGIVPVIAALGLAVLLRQLLQIERAGQRDLGRLALVAGAALAFITVAIPLQLEHQWITIGWALEGAALAWLYTRIPHRGLLYFALALLGAVFVRLALNPEVFRYEPRGALRILNWYLYTYLLAAAAFFAAARWLWKTDDGVLGGTLRPSRLLPGGAVVLLFLLLNIEIADFYATGPEIMFRFGAGVSQDLTYTIAWLVFGMLLLAAGIYANARPARVTAVALIAVTAFKCFLYDLGSLGGLYRVGSFVGLGISLALVSLVLQKYVLAKPRESS
jgi:uncharacterized membrane protein